jgi:hypothetical protein
MATGFMMTAEIPLLETEVPGFLLAAKENSLAVAAIHNHVIGESPRVIFALGGGKFRPGHARYSYFGGFANDDPQHNERFCSFNSKRFVLLRAQQPSGGD